MNVDEWLDANAEVVEWDSGLSDEPSKIWVTKARGDYITHVGMEDKDTLQAILNRGATQFVSSSWQAGKPINIAFNPEEQKWYGWSHRAICGFAVGDTCKKGDVHYRPVDKDDYLDDMLRFWSDEYSENIRGEHTDKGVLIEWEYNHKVPNESLRGQIGSQLCTYPDEYGKGEWTAKTMADARQMAIDFANEIA